MASALRAASELCGVDALAEVEPIPTIPPVVAHVSGTTRRIWVFVLHAKHAAPESDDDDSDKEEEDTYDWFTWPEAMSALSTDAGSIQALRAMAYNIACAADAQPPALPTKWGGYFGSEFIGGKVAATPTRRAPPAPAVPSTVITPGGSPAARVEQGIPRDVLAKWYPRVPLPAARRLRQGDGHPPQPSHDVATGTAAPKRREPSRKFRAHRPFHPQRLALALTAAQQALDLRPWPSSGPEGATRGGATRRPSPAPRSADDRDRKKDETNGEEEEEEDDDDDTDGRLRGLAWLVTQPGLQADIGVNGEDGSVYVEPGQAWWACIPKSKWPPGLEDEIQPLWREPHGDRQTELTLPRAVGSHEVNVVAKIRNDLEAALVTDAEWAETAGLEDPWAEAWQVELKATEKAELGARLRSEVGQAFATVATTPAKQVGEKATTAAKQVGEKATTAAKQVGEKATTAAAVATRTQRAPLFGGAFKCAPCAVPAQRPPRSEIRRA